MPINKRLTDLGEMGDDYERAEFALNARRYDLAIEIMQRVLSHSPENSVAFHTIARAYVFKKMNAQAIDAIKESLRLDPDSSTVHTLYASLLKDMGPAFWKETEEELLIALRLNPANHLAHYVYGWFLLEQRKNIPAAREHCLKALEMQADDAKYHLEFAVILAQEKQFEAAEAEYQRALSLEPEDARTHNSYGAFLLNHRHNARAAFEHFRAALAQDPDNAMIRKNFLLATKARHKGYWLYWRYGHWLRRFGKKRGLVHAFTLLLFLFICAPIVVFTAQSNIPLLALFGYCFWCLPILFWLYLRCVDPFFNFLVKHGWIK